MRRQTFGPPGRRGTVIAASAAVLCLGATLAGCGNGTGGDGYTAVGAARSAPAKAPSGAVAPSGKVTLVPLDGDERGGGGGRGDAGGDGRRGGASPAPGSSAASRGADGAGGAGGAGDGGAGGSGGAAGRPGTPGRAANGSGTTGGSGTGGASPTGGSGGSGSGSSGPATPSAPGSTAPAGAAVLKVGAPERAAADKRWCEKVTVEFRNTGGSPARSGTVTFATHIIGGLGIDWATRESTAPLPAPIGAGAARKKTYTVCVDAWRVPLGMHVETRDVTAVWK
ncbi:hypothetical protein AB0C61_09560 [Streptomyces sp. NPDC048680]|uniref:hypothetical protein n=1 Tax=Streptomyces sp. NPDC048680 TaxID=3155492 RepID=UPI003438A7B6